MTGGGRKGRSRRDALSGAFSGGLSPVCSSSLLLFAIASGIIMGPRDHRNLTEGASARESSSPLPRAWVLRFIFLVVIKANPCQRHPNERIRVVAQSVFFKRGCDRFSKSKQGLCISPFYLTLKNNALCKFIFF